MLLFEYEHGRRGIPRCAREIRLYGFVGSASATSFELLSVACMYECHTVWFVQWLMIDGLMIVMNGSGDAWFVLVKE